MSRRVAETPDSLAVLDTALFGATYDAFVRLLQDSGYELRSSRLGGGVWIAYVTPRPLLTIRTRYDGHTQALTVHSRRLLRYVERCRARVTGDNVGIVASAAVAAHDRAAWHNADGTSPPNRSTDGDHRR